MTGVPSIVMGLFIYTLVVLNTKEKTGFAGALALACLMLPIVIRTTDQMLSLVPRRAARGQLRAREPPGPHHPDRRAAQRGARASSAARCIAVARAAGETAPLLFTIGIVTRDEHEPVQRPEHRAVGPDLPQRHVAVHPGQQDRAWGAALTLIVIVFVFTILARLVTAFFARRQAA